MLGDSTNNPTLPHTSAEITGAMEAIARRLLTRIDELEAGALDYYVAGVPDYRALARPLLERDVGPVTRVNFEWFLQHVSEPAALGEAAAEISRRGLSRRARQGMPLESALKVIRLWGRYLWTQVVPSLAPDDPIEREAGLRLAGQIMAYVDAFSAIAEEHWLEEARGIWSDQEVARRDLAELLVAGRNGSEAAIRQAERLRLALAQNYLAILIRSAETAPRAPERNTLRGCLELARDRIVQTQPGTIAIIRHGEVLVLRPVRRLEEVMGVKRQFAESGSDLLELNARIGIGGFHLGAAGVPMSYDEGRQAVTRALRAGSDDLIAMYDDMVLDRMVRGEPDAHLYLQTTLERLREHDSAGRTNLLATLRAYVNDGFNLTRAARALAIHPNTLTYRLKRIHDVTGRDPRNAEDIVVLALALRLDDLAAGS